ncbi:hypothetical protein [Agrobacterium tumefaciens]|uniref:hypothetical protein n=1 Tax=Agrobacterium tumefaciens TaxID=358 RepID=UPI000EF2A5CE|nr:hypothetical protein [Agrobacterium tumefaciens]AYM08893.1 hypothetical protein At1D1460_46520 [Agrobacterium tumefaciens]NSZ36015.1 hypothetical protein [Agrobacterium tumefaciens]QLG25277.1 hypothetical protein EML4_23440 [Agrobacterium tumefaciens]UXS87434.1 hypothetical protein FY144_14085 [Agrobacterium tumefaciens]
MNGPLAKTEDAFCIHHAQKFLDEVNSALGQNFSPLLSVAFVMSEGFDCRCSVSATRALAVADADTHQKRDRTEFLTAVTSEELVSTLDIVWRFAELLEAGRVATAVAGIVDLLGLADLLPVSLAERIAEIELTRYLDLPSPSWIGRSIAELGARGQFAILRMDACGFSSAAQLSLLEGFPAHKTFTARAEQFFYNSVPSVVRDCNVYLLNTSVDDVIILAESNLVETASKNIKALASLRLPVGLRAGIAKIDARAEAAELTREVHRSMQKESHKNGD